MATSSNPLVGSGWGNQPPANPLPNANPISVGPLNTNPGGYGNPNGANEINRNMGLTNIATGQEKLNLAPQFAQLFGQYGGDAANFFKQLMDLGSPYYQQKQTEGVTEGVNAENNATANAKQKLNAQGYGSTPSGAEAAMVGGMEQAGAQSEAENYLKNLFQNEQMQLQGGQGLASTASMFNPAPLLGGTSAGANIQPNQSFFQQFSEMLSSLSGAGGQSSSGAGATL